MAAQEKAQALIEVITNFKQISPHLLQAIESNPDLIIAVVEMDLRIVDSAFGPLPVSTRIKKVLDRMSEDERETVLKRNAGRINQALKIPVHVLDACLRKGDRARTLLDRLGFREDDPVAELSLERAYHLSELLGDQESAISPLSDAIAGGTAIGADLGCGPACFFTRDEVRALACRLSRLSEDDLRAKLDSGQLDYEVVSSGDLSSALDGFLALRDYYAIAASRGNAIIIYETWYPPLLG